MWCLVSTPPGSEISLNILKDLASGSVSTQLPSRLEALGASYAMAILDSDVSLHLVVRGECGARVRTSEGLTQIPQGTTSMPLRDLVEVVMHVAGPGPDGAWVPLIGGLVPAREVTLSFDPDPAVDPVALGSPPGTFSLYARFGHPVGRDDHAEPTSQPGIDAAASSRRLDAPPARSGVADLPPRSSDPSATPDAAGESARPDQGTATPSPVKAFIDAVPPEILGALTQAAMPSRDALCREDPSVRQREGAAAQIDATRQGGPQAEHPLEADTGRAEPWPSPNTATETVKRSSIRTAEAPTVYAVRCPAGHLSPPQLPLCRVCRQPIPTPQEALAVPRPALGRIRFLSGESFRLDRGLLMGRSPSAAQRTGGEAPNIVRLDDPRSEVSSQHLEISLDAWSVMVTDLGSTNGTQTVTPDGRWSQLAPNVPEVIEPGTRIILAEIFEMTFEVTDE